MRIMPLTPTNRPLNSRSNSTFKGWQPETEENKKSIEQMTAIFDTADIKSAAVSGHCFPDGDSIGSCFAMAHLLNKKINKPVDVYIFGSLPKRFDYLKGDKGDNAIKVIEMDNNTRPAAAQYDLAVSLDTATSHLMNQNYKNQIFDKAKYTFKIDHHREETVTNEARDKTYYANAGFVDSSSPSASELVMQLVEPFGLKPKDLPSQFNNAVYTGILTDSRNFSITDNPLPFNDTALLIQNGLKPQEVYKKTFSNVPKKVVDIVSLAQKKVQFTKDEKIAYLFVDDSINSAINNLGNKELEFDVNNRLKDMVNDLRYIEGVEYAIMFFKRGQNRLYVSARSNNKNIRELAEKHNGGGHDKAAGFQIEYTGSHKVAIDKVLQEFKKY